LRSDPVNVTAKQIIELEIADFEMPDDGKGRYTGGAITLSGTTPQTISLTGVLTGIEWKYGNISLGTENSVELRASQFGGAGKYVITVDFTYEGKVWLVNIDITVQ
jgi:hypothetical protein